MGNNIFEVITFKGRLDGGHGIQAGVVGVRSRPSSGMDKIYKLISKVSRAIGHSIKNVFSSLKSNGSATGTGPVLSSRALQLDPPKSSDNVIYNLDWPVA